MNMVNSKTKKMAETEPGEMVELSLEMLHTYKETGYNPITRRIFIFGEINRDISYHFITAVESMIVTSTEPIKLIINSPGGSVYDLFAIIDYMKLVWDKYKIPIDVLAVGEAQSAAAIITIAATGRRKALKNTSIMLHEVQSFSGYGSTSTKKDDLKHTEDLEERIIAVLIEKTKKKSIPYWKKELERKDKIYFPEEALKLGLIDEIL